VIATGVEYFAQPAIALLVGHVPEESWRVLPNLSLDVGPLAPLEDWLHETVHGPLAGMPLGIVHADPRNPRLVELVEGLASATSGFLVGGLSSAAASNRLEQIADDFVEGGVSGVVFAPNVAVATGLSQGCSPIGPVRRVTAAKRNILIEIDGRPALDVFKEDIGEILARKLERVGGYIHAAFPVSGADTADYMVRNLVGIDRAQKLVAVGEEVASGDRILFVRRDKAAAEDDLVRMVRKLKRSAAAPKAGLYFSCVARGPNLFGPDSAELGILRRELGDFPLVGMFCNGEISHNRLYGYTGVLALFL